jgi:hypothetical protein
MSRGATNYKTTEKKTGVALIYVNAGLKGLSSRTFGKALALVWAFLINQRR